MQQFTISKISVKHKKNDLEMEVDVVDSDDESAKEEKEENRLRKSELELSKLGSGKSIVLYG